MFSDLFSYDPSTISAAHRLQMAQILKVRAELLRAIAELSDLRGRSWVGEKGLEDIIELKAADLTKLRAEYSEALLPFLKDAINIEGLKQLAPMLLMAVLQNLKVPFPIIAEAVGADVGSLKLLSSQIKKLIEEN